MLLFSQNHLLLIVDIKPIELTPDSVYQQGVRLDILAISDDGSQFNVEMQKSASSHMIARSLFYWAFLPNYRIK